MNKKTNPSWMVRKLFSYRKSGSEFASKKEVRKLQKRILALEDEAQDNFSTLEHFYEQAARYANVKSDRRYR